ncbi:MAG: hypothetical protein R6W73_08155 [Candidatus Saliniplasma sp.]
MITGKISETTKVRLMVLPIIAMLMITMMVTGCLEEGEKIEDIDSNHDEMSIEYVGKEKDGVSFRNETTGEYERNATAITYVDGEENHLSFDVIAESIIGLGESQWVRLVLNVEGKFSEEYSPEEFLFTMRALEGENVSRSHQDFDMGFLEDENLNLWPYEELLMGSGGTEKSFLGFDVEKNEFSGEVQVTWTIEPFDFADDYTLKLNSVVRGMSEEVKSTVEVNLTETIE